MNVSALILRYRKYLKAKIVKGEATFDVQTLPWFSPLILAGILCFTFDIQQPVNLILVIPAGAIGVLGIAFVTLVFIVDS